MPIWKEVYPGVEEMEVAVMGCVVNGPGESKAANIGISLPGTFEEPKAPVYMDGEHYTTLKGDHIGEEFRAILNDYPPNVSFCILHCLLFFIKLIKFKRIQLSLKHIHRLCFIAMLRSIILTLYHCI